MRKVINEALKAEAVKLVREEGYKQKEVAERLGLNAKNISRWVKEAKISAAQTVSPSIELVKKLKQLEKEKQAVNDGARYIKKGNGLLCERVALRYAFIQTQKKVYPVSMCCRVMQVSRSGYYRWCSQQGVVTPRAQREAQEIASVRALEKESRDSLGKRRISAALKQAGFSVGIYRARTLMKRAGIVVNKRRPKRVNTTVRAPGVCTIPNRLNRQFQGQPLRAAWVADITYLATQEGWLYLAAVMDIASRRVLGWASAEHMHVSLVIEALDMALIRGKPPKGLIHHSNQGIQYTSAAYQAKLNNAGLIASVSRPGQCLDNAVMERFWGSLKSEWIPKAGYDTRENAQSDVFRYIELLQQCAAPFST